MNDIQTFLAGSPVFRHLTHEQLLEIAPLFRRQSYPAGSVILHQGGHSSAIYFLVTGRLAVRVQRAESRETVAYLTPPDVFGELSFITGRPCVADVEAVADSEAIGLSKDALATLSQSRDAILRGLITPIATRLHDTVARGGAAAETPVVLLKNHPHWEAPACFAAELARSLGRQTGRATLLVNLGTSGEQGIHEIGPRTEVCGLTDARGMQELRGRIAAQMEDWKGRYRQIILNPLRSARPALESAQPFATLNGEMLGPGDPAPAEMVENSFAVQSAKAPTLPFLSGRQQLIHDAAESEAAYLSGASATPGFRRTVDSIARAVAGVQVGLALGGGAAWGWGHIGVLKALEGSGLPIDMISGCSMGSVIGALRASGRTAEELEQIALYWRTHTRRFIEWKLWRLCLINESAVRKAFRGYFGASPVNQTPVPFWANAVDVVTGREVTIRTGSLVECLRASISLPGLLPPFQHKPHLLVDAAIMDPIPVRLVRAMGSNFAVAVNSMADPETTTMRRSYPFSRFEIMTRCMFLSGHAMGQARAEPAADVVFTPDLSGVSMLDFSRSAEIMERGRQAAEKYLPSILSGYQRLCRQNTGD